MTYQRCCNMEMKDRGRKVGIVILNFNNYEDTFECINSVLNIEYKNYEIIVVDNFSSDNSFKRLKAFFGDRVTFVQTDKNYGYAIGNNIGIKRAVSNGAEYVCVLNNDTVVAKDFLESGVDYLEARDDVAFVAPVLLNYSDQQVQSCGGNINLWTGGAISRWSKDPYIVFVGKNQEDIKNNLSCEYVGGACLLFKKQLLDEIGFIPENYFLFFEETEWCYKARKYGYKNMCLANWAIKHKGSASIKKIGGLSEYMLERNRVVFVKRNRKNIFQYIMFLILIFSRAIVLGLFRDKRMFQYLKYYADGIHNRVDKKYDFVIVRDS